MKSMKSMMLMTLAMGGLGLAGGQTLSTDNDIIQITRRKDPDTGRMVYEARYKSYGPGRNQRKRRKLARQSPNCSKWQRRK